jgi:hypothetical protein
MATIRYHINSKGNPGVCKAQARNCPFGGVAKHFPTKEVARACYEKEMAQKPDSKAVKRFPIDDPLWYQGGCEALALKVSARTGWPAITLSSSYLPPDEYGAWPRHTVIQTPDGKMLDSKGIREWPRDSQGRRPEPQFPSKQRLKGLTKQFLKNMGKEGILFTEDDLDTLAAKLIKRELSS